MRELERDLTLHDYNSDGQWSVASVQRRYADYCRQYAVQTPVVPIPREHQSRGNRWVYPVMEAVIEGIERDDPASIAIGIDFIEEDVHFPFGKTLKSNTARALRRASLAPEQVTRIRNRVTRLFLAGHIPHEFREYARLFRHVGIAECWPLIKGSATLEDPYVKRFYEYFRQCAERETENNC